MLFEVLNQELFKEAAQEATLSELLENHWSHCCWFQIWNVSLSEKICKNFAIFSWDFKKDTQSFVLTLAGGWAIRKIGWLSQRSCKKMKTPPDHVFKNYNFQRWLSTMIQGLISDGNALKKGSMFHHGSLTYSPIWSCIRYIAPKTGGWIVYFFTSENQKDGFWKQDPFWGLCDEPQKKNVSDSLAICHLQTGHAYG